MTAGEVDMLRVWFCVMMFMTLFMGIDDVGNLKKVGEVCFSINNTSVDVTLHT